MKGGLNFLAFILFISVLTLSYAGEVKEFKPAPDFKMQDLYQDVFKLSDYKDKQPAVLFFWTSWCPFCQNELRVLNGMYAGLVEDGTMLLSVNVGELPDAVDNFTRSYHLSYRVLLDRDTSVSRSFGMQGVPTYILIDKKGRIIFKGNYFPQKEYKDLIAGKYD
ncbi:TlpA family protein disulfide reductase [bacterium]|nr:MAG: TlpA family protein disulfide reductase [bacterium]